MVTTVTKLGTWSGIFGRRSKLVKEMAEDMRTRIVGLHPDVVEVPRKSDKSVAFGFGEKKLSEAYCYLMPQTGYLNLGFPWGAALDDPNQLLEGNGKKLRHVKIIDQGTARSAKIAHLLHLAMMERKKGLEKAPAKKPKSVAKKSAAKKTVSKKAPAKKRATKKEDA